jgi:hypothetical protein
MCVSVEEDKKSYEYCSSSSLLVNNSFSSKFSKCPKKKFALRSPSKSYLGDLFLDVKPGARQIEVTVPSTVSFLVHRSSIAELLYSNYLSAKMQRQTSMDTFIFHPTILEEKEIEPIREGLLLNRVNSPTIDNSLSNLFGPVSEHIATISRFVDLRTHPKFGMVCKYMVVLLRKFLDTWRLQTTDINEKLKEKETTIYEINLLIKTQYRTIKWLTTICTEIAQRNLTGASLLNLLITQACHVLNNFTNRTFITHLFLAASVPYMRFVEQWIYKGSWNDLFTEGLIFSKTYLCLKDFQYNIYIEKWIDRFVIAPEIPLFLNNIAKKMLKSGREKKNFENLLPYITSTIFYENKYSAKNYHIRYRFTSIA